MKKFIPLLGLTLLQALLLSAAFVAGYYLRAFTFENAPLPLPGARSNYPLLDEARALLQAHYINAMPDEETCPPGLEA